MKIIIAGLISILFLLNGCNNPIDKSDILTKQLKTLLRDDYKENANYIIITKNGCLSCISKNIIFLKNHPQYLRNYNCIITTKTLIEYFPYIMDLKIVKYIDTSNVLENLNTGVMGFSTVTIEEDKVIKLQNSNILITSEDSKMDTFFKTEINNNYSNSYFIELFRSEFEQKIPIKELESNKLNRKTLIFFTSDHCAPCKKMFPIIDSLSMIYNDSIDFYFIKSNKKDNMKIFHDYDIHATPTIVVFKKNQPIIQEIGLLDKKEIIRKLFEDKN